MTRSVSIRKDPSCQFRPGDDRVRSALLEGVAVSRPRPYPLLLSLLFILLACAVLSTEASAKSARMIITAKPMQPVTLATPAAPTPPGPDSTDAQGSTQVSSGAGVYGRTPAEYASVWGFGLIAGCAGGDHWFWWLFKTDGTVKLNGEKFAGCDSLDLKRPGGNTYYWKELNHTGDHALFYPPHSLTWYVCWNVGQYC